MVEKRCNPPPTVKKKSDALHPCLLKPFLTPPVIQTPQDPLAVYFRDNIFLGFTSLFWHCFRPISLCLWHRKEITGLFTTACYLLSVLEKLPVSYWLPRGLLFFRHGKGKPFRFLPWGMSSGSLIIVSALLSASKVAGVFLKGSAPNRTQDSSRALTNVEITPCRVYSCMQPRIMLFFFLSIMQQLDIANSRSTGDPR